MTDETNVPYRYEAFYLGDEAWMVKRWDKDDRCTEALIDITTTDPQVAIAAAITRGSWA